jgi:hypothetical protein
MQVEERRHRQLPVGGAWHGDVPDGERERRASLENRRRRRGTGERGRHQQRVQILFLRGLGRARLLLLGVGGHAQRRRQQHGGPHRQRLHHIATGAQPHLALAARLPLGAHEHSPEVAEGVALDHHHQERGRELREGEAAQPIGDGVLEGLGARARTARHRRDVHETHERRRLVRLSRVTLRA